MGDIIEGNYGDRLKGFFMWRPLQDEKYFLLLLQEFRKDEKVFTEEDCLTLYSQVLSFLPDGGLRGEEGYNFRQDPCYTFKEACEACIEAYNQTEDTDARREKRKRAFTLDIPWDDITDNTLRKWAENQWLDCIGRNMVRYRKRLPVSSNNVYVKPEDIRKKYVYISKHNTEWPEDIKKLYNNSADREKMTVIDFEKYPYDHWDGFYVKNLTKWCKEEFGEEWDKARKALQRGEEYKDYRLGERNFCDKLKTFNRMI